ncbi:hypothetical protein glysoja_036142, partial [Glycine soja]
TVWRASVWTLWNHKNAHIFRNHVLNVDQVFETIIFKSWLWLSSKLGGFKSSFYEWYSHPDQCLK